MKNMENIKNNKLAGIFSMKNIIAILITLTIFLIDRVTKISIIRKLLAEENSITLNKYLNLELVWNTGIGFGLLNLDANIFYHLISIFIFLITVVILIVMIDAKGSESIMYSLILGGAVGNLYDRVMYFAVPDFIDFHIGNYHWFTFNIADIFISIGIILLILKEFSVKRNLNK